ncbi:MAG: hypothetical protein ABH804_01800 [archaeon]
MSIIAKVEDTEIEFRCANSGNWNELILYCPSIKKVFYDADNFLGSKKVLKYKISYKDDRLKIMQSELDKEYKEKIEKNIDEPVVSLARDIRRTVLKSMSLKKDLEVVCFWR